MVTLLILIAFSAAVGIASYVGWPVRPAIGTAQTRLSRAAYDSFLFFLGMGLLFAVERMFPKMPHYPLLDGGLILLGGVIAWLLRPAFNEIVLRLFGRG